MTAVDDNNIGFPSVVFRIDGLGVKLIELKESVGNVFYGGVLCGKCRTGYADVFIRKSQVADKALAAVARSGTYAVSGGEYPE